MQKRIARKPSSLNRALEPSSYSDEISSFILIVVTALFGIGCVLLYSASYGDINPWVAKQLITFVIFMPIALLCGFIDPDLFYRHSYYIYVFCLTLLCLSDLMGHTAMGAQRWIRLGGVANFQPSELMKIAVILLSASYLHRLSYSMIKEWRHLASLFVLITISTLMILKQPNLGTATIIFLLSFSIMFCAGVDITKFAIIGGLTAISAPLIWHYVLHEYQKNRILNFLNPEDNLLSTGYNVMQSKIAIGSGGFFGKGFLSGTQGQLNFLPEKHTDFIFSILAEEWGLLGVIMVLLLYTLLIILCYIVALGAKNTYGRLVSSGVASFFFIHLFINVGMISGLLPVVGIPLPFLSYGGSNLAVCLISVGLVLSVRRYR